MIGSVIPALRMRLTGEPAIGPGMWLTPEADASILRRDGGAVAPRARARGDRPPARGLVRLP